MAETSTVTSSSMTLPESQKLTGEKNYESWKNAMTELANGNSLYKHIRPDYKHTPKFVDENDDKVNMDDLKKWEDWSRSDFRMKSAIRVNVKPHILRLIDGTKSAKEAWEKLKTQFEGEGLAQLGE
jgi:hypothetical protein